VAPLTVSLTDGPLDVDRTSPVLTPKDAEDDAEHRITGPRSH
jgi:hypothetical protein